MPVTCTRSGGTATPAIHIADPGNNATNAARVGKSGGPRTPNSHGGARDQSWLWFCEPTVLRLSPAKLEHDMHVREKATQLHAGCGSAAPKQFHPGSCGCVL